MITCIGSTIAELRSGLKCVFLNIKMFMCIGVCTDISIQQSKILQAVDAVNRNGFPAQANSHTTNQNCFFSYIHYLI